MVGDELKRVFDEISKESKRAEKKDLSGDFNDILKQRHFQRKVLFQFSLRVNIVSYLILILVFIFQAWQRAKYNPQFNLFDGRVMEVFTSVVFIQSFGIIVIIAKSIWDDKPYRTLLLKENEKKNNKKLLDL